MKNKRILIIIFLILAFASLFWFIINKNFPKEKAKTRIYSTEKSIDTVAVFRQFVDDFNTHKSEKINHYIDPKLGMIMYYHDGPYPIIEDLKNIERNLDWINEDIFTEVKLSNFPDYLGDFQFSKTGFFVQKNIRR